MGVNNSNFNRRKFLTASISSVVTVGLAGISPKITLAQDFSKATENSQDEIIYRQLGKTNINMPIVGMGVMNANNPEIVRASYEIGIRHFDTAANYQFGRNEQMVGKVISHMGVRDNVIIGTKILVPQQRQGLNPAEIKDKAIILLEGSLKRLKTDYIDILCVHDVNNPEEISNPALTEAMNLLKQQGKVRAIGISTHSNMAEVINEVARTGNYDVVLTAINFTMADDESLLGAIKNAASKGIGIIAMKTQAGGARWPNPESRRNYSSSTITKAALKWVLRNENITTSIPGFVNYEHMKEDFSVAFNLKFTPDEKKLLSDNNVKLSMGFCRQCRQCLTSCPNSIDIPTLMRIHMYAAQYGDFYLARATLDEIPKGKGLEVCKSCHVCTARCLNTVDIPRRIDELKMMYT